MIGTSEGQQYNSELEAYVSSTMPPGGSRMLQDASKSNSGTEVAPSIVRTHDVPLAASALIDKDGNHYATAIDKDAPIRSEYDQYIHKHEGDEWGYMKDLMKNGMDTHEAYKKAHDHITPMESARVQADLGEKGLEDYKQYWRDVSSVAKDKENPNRHPDAHTTTYELDEKELGRKYQEKVQKSREFVGGLVEPLEQMGRLMIGKSTDTTADIAGVASNFIPAGKLSLFMGVGAKTFDHAAATEASVLKGQGKSISDIWKKTGTYFGGDKLHRQEIPDINSNLKMDAFMHTTFKDFRTNADRHYLELDSIKRHVLGDILHHPELYKAYPDLKNYEVKPTPPEHVGAYSGMFDPKNKTMYLSHSSYPENIRKTLLHETQHAIQQIEGFDPGTNPEYRFQEALAALDRRRGYVYRGDTPPIQDKELADLSMDMLKHRKAFGYYLYHRDPGEIESRNVEYRSDFNEYDRAFVNPEVTEDVVPLRLNLK